MFNYAQRTLETNAAIDTTIADLFPPECVTDCPALRLVVGDHKQAMSINAEKGLSSVDSNAYDMADARRTEMSEEFSERITFMAERCMRATQ